MLAEALRSLMYNLEGLIINLPNYVAFIFLNILRQISVTKDFGNYSWHIIIW